MSYFSSISFESGQLRRAVAFAVVVALHVGMILGLNRWTASRATEPVAAPLEVQLLADAVVPEEPPPPPPLRVDPVLPDVPVIEIADAPAPAANAITVAVRLQPEAPAPYAASGPVVISDAAYVREPRPIYPAASRREHEHGVVVLKVLIGVDGSAARVEIQHSSGYERLDRAAREAVLRALFRSYIENGIARPAVVLVPVEFEMNTRVARRDNHSGRSGRHSLDTTILTETSP